MPARFFVPQAGLEDSPELLQAQQPRFKEVARVDKCDRRAQEIGSWTGQSFLFDASPRLARTPGEGLWRRSLKDSHPLASTSCFWPWGYLRVDQGSATAPRVICWDAGLSAQVATESVPGTHLQDPCLAAFVLHPLITNPVTVRPRCQVPQNCCSSMQTLQFTILQQVDMSSDGCWQRRLLNRSTASPAIPSRRSIPPLPWNVSSAWPTAVSITDLQLLAGTGAIQSSRIVAVVHQSRVSAHSAASKSGRQQRRESPSFLLRNRASLPLTIS